MKILVFTSLYPNNIWPNHGVFIKERMRHVAKLKDCHIKVVAPVPYFPPVKLGSRFKYSQVHRHEIRDNIEIFHPRYIMTPKVGMSSYGWLMYKSTLRTVKQIQNTFDFDLIDAHYIYPDGYAAMLLGRALNKPVVVSARGSDINQFVALPRIRKKLQATIQHTDHSIAVCQALKDAMVALDPSAQQTTVIPNGVDAQKFFPVNRELARRKLNLPDVRIILSVGQLIPRKGMNILIQAFKKIVDASTEPKHLVIAGEGESRHALAELVRALDLENNVSFVGNRPHADLNLYYNAADVSCLASSREGWPNVVMESLACGTPVVATNIWGTPEILVSDTLGLLTERTASDMAANLHLALDKSWDRNAILSHMQQHTWKRAAQSVNAVFEHVLQKEDVVEHSLSS